MRIKNKNTKNNIKNKENSGLEKDLKNGVKNASLKSIIYRQRHQIITLIISPNLWMSCRKIKIIH
jgi:hypothetical protein